jgi:hypothetical protein
VDVPRNTKKTHLKELLKNNAKLLRREVPKIMKNY